MRVLVASGSPREVGRAIGEDAADLVRAAVELICRFDVPEAELEARLSAVRTRLEETFPHVLEEAEGLAEGAGVAADEILSLSVSPDLSGRLPGYCSLAAVPTERGVLVGKNLDTTERMGRLQVVQRIEPDEGHAYAHVTTAGAMWTDGGVNDAGLALVNASVAAGRSEPRGVPDGIFARELLRSCADVPEALELAGAHELRSLGENILVADAAGRSAVVEKLPGGTATRASDERAAVVACNHVLSPELAGLMAPDDEIQENSARRFERLDAARRRPGEWTEERLRALLTEPAGGIWQNGEDGLFTVATVELSPAERRLSIVSARDGGAEVSLATPTSTPRGAGKEEPIHGRSQ
jgi:isopenicillin-N N-acyltransferase like protein